MSRQVTAINRGNRDRNRNARKSDSGELAGRGDWGLLRMSNIYKSGEYLELTGNTWHSEDSPWKAEQVMHIIRKNDIHPKRIAEIGCGAGRILAELSRETYLKDVQFEGYDISPQAIELCKKLNAKNCTFLCQDLLAITPDNKPNFDILLIIDVVEHIPDYMGFANQCRGRATYKIYHFPLDIHVSSVLRKRFLKGRYSLGHLHYFTAESALATLKDTGHEIVDYCYTSGAIGLFKHHPSIKTALANGPRWLLSQFSLPFAARVLGGYSLLVLAK
jgi:SAM-dependent methyltransferase